MKEFSKTEIFNAQAHFMETEDGKPCQCGCKKIMNVTGEAMYLFYRIAPNEENIEKYGWGILGHPLNWNVVASVPCFLKQRQRWDNASEEHKQKLIESIKKAINESENP